MKTMNPEIKQQWCDALRAYNMQINNSQLKVTGNMSPDGILTDLYLKAHGLEWELIESKYCAHGRSHTMPDQVLTWSGLDTYDPLLPSAKSIRNSLVEPPTMSRVVSATVYSEAGTAITRVDYKKLADFIEADL